MGRRWHPTLWIPCRLAQSLLAGNLPSSSMVFKLFYCICAPTRHYSNRSPRPQSRHQRRKAARELGSCTRPTRYATSRRRAGCSSRTEGSGKPCWARKPGTCSSTWRWMCLRRVRGGNGCGKTSDPLPHRKPHAKRTTARPQTPTSQDALIRGLLHQGPVPVLRGSGNRLR